VLVHAAHRAAVGLDTPQLVEQAHLPQHFQVRRPTDKALDFGLARILDGVGLLIAARRCGQDPERAAQAVTYLS
jgi:hypothetical protein